MGVALAAGIIAAGAVAGGAAGYLGSKKKTKIPPWSPMNIPAEQGKAIQSNITNLPAAEKLTSQANTFTQDQVLSMLNKVSPGFSKNTEQVSKLFESGLKGEIPQDVQTQLALRDAGKAVSGGYGGSGMQRNLEARDFGLTSYQITQNTLNSFESWTKTMASVFEPGMINISSSFISPETWLKQVQSDKENTWKVKMGQAIEKAQPSRTEMALSSGLSTLGSGLSFIGGAMLGGGGGAGAKAASSFGPAAGSFLNMQTTPKLQGAYGGTLTG